MAEFSINTSNVNGTASQLNGYAGKLNAMSAEILMVRSNLSIKVAQTDNIKSRLKSISDSLLTEKKSMTNMSNAIGQVVTEYKKAEMRVVTKAAGAKTVSILRESGIIPGSKNNSIAFASALTGIGAIKTGIWSKFKEWYNSIASKKHTSGGGSSSGGHSSGKGRHDSAGSSSKKGSNYLYTDASGNVTVFRSKEEYINFLKQNGVYYVDDGKNIKIFPSKEAYNQYLKENNQYYSEDAEGNVTIYANEAEYNEYLKSLRHQENNKNYNSPKNNANGYDMVYYGQGTYAEDFTYDNFKNNEYDYSNKTGVACATCCEAMLLTYFGADVKPIDLLVANGGSASWDGTGVKDKMAEYGVKMTITSRKANGATPEQLATAIDNALNDFVDSPDTNGPVFVSTNLASGTHYVLIVGKDEAGKYIVVDPGSRTRTTISIDNVKMVVKTTKN